MSLEFIETDVGDKGSEVFDMDKVAEEGSSLATDLNKVNSDMFGVDVIYFRSIPGKNSEDVIYMNYTLLNVEDCPTPLKVFFQDSSYLAGDYTVTLYEMDYNVPVQIQIDVKTWFEAYGAGTMPQRYDLLYIPILHKIYEVDSTNQGFGFMEQFTHFNLTLKKYDPKEFRRESASLADTIDTYTATIEELFGDKAETEIADIVDSNQNDMYNSTSMDDYKYFSQKRCRVLEENRKTYYVFNPVPSFEITSYDAKVKEPFAVEYKNGYNIDSAKHSIFFSTLFRYSHRSENIDVRLGKIAIGKRYVDAAADKVPLQEIIIDCNINILPDHMQAGDKLYIPGLPAGIYFKEIRDNKLVCYMRYVDYINNKDIVHNMSKIEVAATVNQSLIAAVDRKSDIMKLNITVENDRIFDIVIDGDIYKVEVDKRLKDKQWYGLAVLLDNSGKSKLWVYTVTFGHSIHIRKFDIVDILGIKLEGIYTADRVGLVGSYIDQSNIRLYTLPVKEASELGDKQVRLDLTADYVENNSYTIVNDDCLLTANKQHNIFIGKHK